MNNTYLDNFVGTLNRRYNKDSANMTHGEWMCKNTSLNKKPFSFTRYPFQLQIANDMHDNLDCMKPSQVGLALALETPILTMEGWSTMGELCVGDTLFDEKGEPCKVTYISPIYTDHVCYELEFDTGEVIIADANHRWYVEGDKAFNEKELWGKTGQPAKGFGRKGIVNTQMLSENYHQKGRNIFAIPVAQPLRGSFKELLIEPYLLGFWLGDGHSHSSTVTVHDSDFSGFKEKITSLGYEIQESSRKHSTACYKVSLPRDKDICPRGHSKAKEGIVGPWKTCALCLKQNKGKEVREESKPYDTLYSRFVKLDLIKNKHIPNEYLSASYEQRLALLQGLMDTDGSVTKRGRCSFYNTNTLLVSQVEQLIHSLGFKVRTRWKTPSPGVLKDGHIINSVKPVAEVSFVAYSNTKIFNLERKQSRLLHIELGRPEEALRRRIVSVKRVDTVDVRCISVDSPSHLFLAGKGLIPTHNTEIQIRKALSILKRMDNRSLIYTMPNDKMFKRISKTRIQPIIENDKAFRSDSGNKNSMSLIQVGTSFLYVTGSTEGDATSINADLIFNDEVDLTDQTMLALFNSRVQGSDLRIQQRFSTPTYAGYGIHKGYSASDQHEFMIKCRSCNHWQIPLFNKDFITIRGISDRVEKLTDLEVKLLDEGLIKLDDVHVHCEKCKRKLNLSDYERRSWVPRFEHRTHHRGYHVRPFSTHTLTPKYILTQLFDYKRRNNMKGFFNTVLGETYDQGNSRLNLITIQEAMKGAGSPVVTRSDMVFIGIDVGLTCNIVLGLGSDVEKMKVIHFETVSESQLFSRVQGLMKKYNIVGGGMDKYPYTPTANAMRDATAGIIMPVEYGKGKEFLPIKNEFDQQIGVRASRTMLLDYVADGIRNGTWELYGYGDDKSIIETHLQDMVREDGDGEKEATWVKLNGNDHYFHALAFMMAGVRNYEFQLQKKEYQNIDDDIFGTEFDFTNGSIFVNSSLVGYSSETPRRKALSGNIIRPADDIFNPFSNM